MRFHCTNCNAYRDPQSLDYETGLCGDCQEKGVDVPLLRQYTGDTMENEKLTFLEIIQNLINCGAWAHQLTNTMKVYVVCHFCGEDEEHGHDQNCPWLGLLILRDQLLEND